jgi:phosphohistidine phosphatase SixA
MTRYFSLTNLAAIALLVFCTAGSCNDSGDDSVAVLQWENPTPNDSALFQSGTLFTVKTNKEVTYTAINATVSSSGLVTPTIVNGKITITAKLASDTSKKLSKVFYYHTQKALLDSLAKGGFIISYRHADASRGSDIFTTPVAEWWKSCDPTLARQLTQSAGYVQSANLGKALKALRIPVSQIISSEYCRCKETATNMNVTTNIITNQDITYYVYNEANRYNLQMNLINGLAPGAQNIALIGHAGFGSTPAIAPLASLAWGDCAIFKPNGAAGPATYLGTITAASFVPLAN